MVQTACKGIVFAAACTLLWAGWKYGRHRIERFSKIQQAAALGLVFWSMLVFYMTLLTFACDPLVYETGFTPFHSLTEIYRYGQYDLAWQLVFNIAMFIPFGLLLPVLFREARSASMMLTVGFMITLGIECTQLFVGRSFDVDDIICNTIGALVGYGVYILIQTCLRLKAHEQIHPRARVVSVLTALCLALMAVYPVSFYL